MFSQLNLQFCLIVNAQYDASMYVLAKCLDFTRRINEYFAIVERPKHTTIAIRIVLCTLSATALF